MMSAPGISVSTVQGREKTAEREILEALEEAADELDPEGAEKDQAKAASNDIEDELARELEELRGGPKTGKSERFRLCKRDNACVVYIVVLAPLDPVRLVQHILAKCETTAKCGFRSVQRLTPISRTGPGNKTVLVELSEALLPEGLRMPDNAPVKVCPRASEFLSLADHPSSQSTPTSVTRANSSVWR
jgi:tRNA acetyltransferase TAN1